MSDELKEDISPESRAAGYEKEDANPRMVIGITILTVVLIAVMVLGVVELFVTTKEQQYEASVLKPESAPIRDLRTADAEILNSYRILDSTNKVYQIPISRAMELLADEALKSQDKAGQRGKK